MPVSSDLERFLIWKYRLIYNNILVVVSTGLTFVIAFICFVALHFA